MSSMESFYTREKANKGIKVPLSLPNGEDSGQFFIVRGIDSDEFRKADAKALRIAMVIAEVKDAEEKEQIAKDMQMDILVSLIADWSLDEECNEENIRKLLTEAPQLADAVDRLAAKRSLFFVKESSD